MRAALIIAALTAASGCVLQGATPPAAAAGGAAPAPAPARASAQAPLEAPAAALPPPDAVAMLRAGDGAPRGSVSLWRAPAGLLLRVEASGLPPGWHGFHIHAVGRCEDASFQSAGPHAGHGGGAHGLLNVAGPENGDLVNLFADASGRVRAEVFTGLVSLDGQNARPAIMDGDGAAFVIHASADDHTSQPIGGAGPRIACGVVTKG